MPFDCKCSHLDIELPEEPHTCRNLWQKRGIGTIFAYGHCCPEKGCLSCLSCGRQNPGKLGEYYTDDAYTVVRNHPLFIAASQKTCSKLIEHPYNTLLRKTKFNSFGHLLNLTSFFIYITYLGLLTTIILMGKHPQHFYERANITMTVDLDTCENVSKYFLNNFSQNDEAFKTDSYRIIKLALYAIMISFIIKNFIVIFFLFPKVFRTINSYIEILTLVLTFVHILDWYSWQSKIVFRCPIQYQLGAFSILIAYIHLLVYMRTFPFFDWGTYIVMLQLMTIKFLRFLPILLVIICGFGFTYWMLLQNQSVYGTPGEALLRTAIMLFDLGYDDRLYDSDPESISYYKLVYVIFIITAVAFPIFVINLLIGKIYLALLCIVSRMFHLSINKLWDQ
jgi:hypothetical protein